MNPKDTAYRVLARKYRPQNFSDLIGQEPMVRTLTNAFDMGRIAQAWMLTGVRGVGKTTTARILARALNYKTDTIDKPTIHLDEYGEHCQAIMEGRHVDVVEMDAASHTGIDDIREIIEQVRYRPVSARYKVYIIDEVHMLSTQAFNGLLKTLEEPPPHAKFIFATTEIRKVPITVLSRCQRFDLRRVDAAQLTDYLQKIVQKEQMQAETAALAMIARAGDGSVRDCLSILDQAIAHSGNSNSENKDIIIQAETVRSMLGLADKAQIIDLFRLLMSGEVAKALEQLQYLYNYGAEPSVVIRELMDFNHFVTRLKFQPNLAEDISLTQEERQEGAQLADRLSVRILSRNWQMLLKGLSEVETAIRPMAAAEMLLIRLCHAADLPNLDETLQALEQSKKANGAPVTLVMQPSSLKTESDDVKKKTIIDNSSQNEDVISSKTSNLSQSLSSETTPAEIADKNTVEDSQPVLQHSSVSEPKDRPKQQENTSTIPASENPTHNALRPKETNQSIEKPNLEAENKNIAHLSDAAHSKSKTDNETKAKQAIYKQEFGLKHLLKMAELQNDPKLKYYLHYCIRPVLLEAPIAGDKQQGVFQFVAINGAPSNIEKQINDMLFTATGQRWQVQRLEQGGGATREEEEKKEQHDLRQKAESNENIAAILHHFPDAKLVKVEPVEDSIITTPSDDKDDDN